jgi:hypothetical protein
MKSVVGEFFSFHVQIYIKASSADPAAPGHYLINFQ